MTEVRSAPSSSRLRVALALATLGACVVSAAQATDPPAVRSTAALELIVLGSGGPGATGRAGSGYLVLIDGKPRVLVDAGPGTFVRLGEARVALDSLDVVLLTHLHADHATELPGIVKARAVAGAGPSHFEVFGPGGRAATTATPAFPSTSRFIQLLFGANGAFAYLKDFAAPVSFTVTDLPRSHMGSVVSEILSRPDLTISAIAGHHGDAPAIIYRLDHGRQSIVFSGDIDPSGLAALGKVAAGATLLVIHAVVLDPPGSPPILYTLHSPPEAIGKLAATSKVKAVLLSHLSPAVEDNRGAVSASIARQYSGPVSFATDGLRIAIP